MDAPARLEIHGPDDRRFLLTCSPVRQADGQIFLLELVSDITEQERLRQRLSEVERLAAVGNSPPAWRTKSAIRWRPS